MDTKTGRDNYLGIVPFLTGKDLPVLFTGAEYGI